MHKHLTKIAMVIVGLLMAQCLSGCGGSGSGASVLGSSGSNAGTASEIVIDVARSAGLRPPSVRQALSDVHLVHQDTRYLLVEAFKLPLTSPPQAYRSQELELTANTARVTPALEEGC